MFSSSNVKIIVFINILINLFIFQFASAQNFSELKRLQMEGGKVSALIVNLNSGKIMSEKDSSQRLSPASVSKLIIGADALETWGPSKVFSTQFYARGEIKNNILNGDLVFLGAGDPYLTNEKLWFLTTDVARSGINKVTGKIIINNSLFGNILADANRSHGLTHSKNAYDAPLSSAAVNFSVLALVVSPAQNAGYPAYVALEPYALRHVKIINNVITTKSGLSKVFVTRNSKNGLDTFNVSGNISINSPIIRVYRSISNANIYAGEVLNEFLNHGGVKTSGEIGIENIPLKITDKLVSQVMSFPLNWQLKGLFEMSNNFIADMLTLNLGVESNVPKGYNFLQSSSQNLENYMQNILLNSQHHSKQNILPITLHSGSGLTPENRLSAQDIVALLKRMYFNEGLFPEFLSALPMPGAEGTLKNRFSNNKSNIMLRAKTGTLTEPFDVVALAGYSRLKNGEWAAFAFIVNGSPQKPSLGVENIRNAIDSDLVQVLEMETK